MATYILVTKNDAAERVQLSAYNGIELVGSQEDFICWKWVNPSSEDLDKAAGYAGHIQTVEISQE